MVGWLTDVAIAAVTIAVIQGVRELIVRPLKGAAKTDTWVDDLFLVRPAARLASACWRWAWRWPACQQHPILVHVRIGRQRHQTQQSHRRLVTAGDHTGRRRSGRSQHSEPTSQCRQYLPQRNQRALPRAMPLTHSRRSLTLHRVPQQALASSPHRNYLSSATSHRSLVRRIAGAASAPLRGLRGRAVVVRARWAP